MTYLNNEMITEALNGQPVYEILNAVRDEAGDYYRRAVPEATATNIQNVGAGINANPALQADFQRLLVMGVVNIAMTTPKLKNDFAWAMGEKIPYGKTIQETAVDVIDPIEFDQYASEDNAKEIFKPNVVTRYYTKNREVQFPTSISKQLLMTAFDSDSAFLGYLKKIMSVLFDSQERSDYITTVLTMESYYKKNKFYVVEMPNVLKGTAQDAESFIERINTIALEMSLGVGTRKYNNQGLVTRTELEELHIIMTPALLSRLKLGVWAKVFNLTEAELKPRIHLVDKFGDSPEIQAVIVDRDFFRIHPNLREMSEEPNGRGLVTTYYWNCFDTFALSDFKNAVVVIDKDLDVPVYDVILPLSNVDIRRGGELTYDYIIRQTDTVNYKPIFTVVKPDGGFELDSATKFDGETLHVSKTEKNTTLQVRATISIEIEDEEGNKSTRHIIGRASVNVVK